ncbi:DUF5134 domain-containing protein [Streptomyces sp. NPDC018347]|uniref:DUF5134 domain-containing protein n=1 Tax=Streptomyces sp. NPDC018347 TaxID=3157193 RepID=UPI0033CFD02E
MINPTGLRWVLTALFVLPALYALWLAAAPGRALPGRVSHVLHAAMGVAMAAMVWPWGMDLPADPQVIVFSAGALWFAATPWFRSPGTEPRRARFLAAVPHVVMMLAMAWMAAVMDGAATASGGHGGGHDMPGMDMSGPDAVGAMSLTGTGQQWTAALLAVFLTAVGLLWLSRAFDRGRVAASPKRDDGAAEPACHAAMAVGMAVMFLLL